VPLLAPVAALHFDVRLVQNWLSISNHHAAVVVVNSVLHRREQRLLFFRHPGEEDACITTLTFHVLWWISESHWKAGLVSKPPKKN
jgi:hypothetical protein